MKPADRYILGFLDEMKVELIHHPADSILQNILVDAENMAEIKNVTGISRTSGVITVKYIEPTLPTIRYVMFDQDQLVAIHFNLSAAVDPSDDLSDITFLIAFLKDRNREF